MTPNPTRLDALHLHNFRAFRDLSLTFHPQLTVLVGRNGMGKTAILDACAIAWHIFVDAMQDSTHSHGFEKGDIRLARDMFGTMVDQLPVGFQATGLVNGEALTWARELQKRRGKTTGVQARQLAQAASRLLQVLRAYADGGEPAPPELPVFAHYGTARLWSELKNTSGKKARAARANVPIDAYLDCLDPRSSFQAFAIWFERVAREAQRVQERAQGAGDTRVPLAVSYKRAVQRVTDRLLEPTGWHSLDWDFLRGCIVATHPTEGELPVDQLSDGVRNTLGLVADLAHRCVRLNPHHGEHAPERSSGVVLIDEVDMHLHPGWQQGVIPALLEAFPHLQFIVTTHSPQVLSTVPRACIRIIEGTGGAYEVREPAQQTEGVPSPDVLTAVMGVDPAPALPIREDLNRYRAMIQDLRHDGEEGQALRQKLEAHFGLSHPEILDLDRLLRFRRLMVRRLGGSEP